MLTILDTVNTMVHTIFNNKNKGGQGNEQIYLKE